MNNKLLGVNITDLKEPNDQLDRTNRQVNNVKTHKFGLGVLVEIKGGVRLYIAEQNRDNDGTPIYCLADKNINGPKDSLNGIYWLPGFSEDGMKAVETDPAILQLLENM